MIRVGIIGCGYWGVNYIRIFNELKDAEVPGICDADVGRLEELEEDYPEIRKFSKLDNLLPHVDAVVVATQASYHFEVAKICLDWGKHVLVEKPLTVNSEDAKKLIKSADGLTLMTGFTFLYNQGIREVKKYFERGDLGTLYYLDATRTNLGPIRDDVSVIWDLATHDISIFNYLLGSSPREVSAVGADILSNDLIDTAFISLEYPKGTLAHIHVSWLNPDKVREIVFVGSQKRVVFNDRSVVERIKVFEKGVVQKPETVGPYEHQFLMRDGDIIIPKLNLGEPLKEQAKHFLSCVGSGSLPTSGGEMGLEVTKVLEAVETSILWGGVPVEVF